MANRTQNWRIRHTDKENPEGFFFIEGDLGKPNHYPRVEVMQEDFGDHNGYDYATRLADAKLIVAAPLLLEALREYVTSCAGPTEAYQKAVLAIQKATE